MKGGPMWPCKCECGCAELTALTHEVKAFDWHWTAGDGGGVRVLENGYEAGWYFWAETWTERHGPFNTYEEASAACDRYAREQRGHSP